MDVQIKAKNLRLTDSLQEYVQSRVRKLERIPERITDAKFELKSERNRTGGEQIVAQFTIATKHAILRAEEKNHDIHAAIDLAVERMARQIQRFHDKKLFHRRRQGRLASDVIPETMAAEAGLTAEEAPGEQPMASNGAAALEDEEPIEIAVRRKRFKIQPMNEEEAIEQMELLGHDFFVFYNVDEAQVNVAYRRRDGQYGVIQPELA